MSDPLYSDPSLALLRDAIKTGTDLHLFVVSKAVQMALHDATNDTSRIRALELIERLAPSSDGALSGSEDELDQAISALDDRQLEELEHLALRMVNMVSDVPSD